MYIPSIGFMGDRRTAISWIKTPSFSIGSSDGALFGAPPLASDGSMIGVAAKNRRGVTMLTLRVSEVLPSRQTSSLA